MKKNENLVDYKLKILLNSRKTYLIILLLLAVYFVQGDNVLNEPWLFFCIKLFLALTAVSIFCYIRFRKFRQYYLRKIKDKFFAIATIIGLSLAIIWLQTILSIPMNLIISFYSRNNEVEYHNCRIQNVITTGFDKIHFVFLNKQYSRYFSLDGHTRRELIDNYWLTIAVKKSIAGTYYLEKIGLQAK